MKYFIIGASGLVGSNFLSYIKSTSVESVGTHLSFPTNNTVYYNVSDLSCALNFDIEIYKPDVIIHCGALTNVDYCQVNEQESFQQTVKSTASIAAIAKQNGCLLVYISTDYVFDGVNGPYTENETPNPINIYGLHKLEAEQIVQNQVENHLIVRVTNVYGDEIRHKNFLSRIVQQILLNKDIELVLPYDQYATPINALDIAKAVVKIIENGGRGVYHLGSTDYYHRVQLFKKIIEYFPEYNKFSLKTFSTNQLNQIAKRPLRGGLLSFKFLSEYPDFPFTNVDSYLKSIKGKLNGV